MMRELTSQALWIIVCLVIAGRAIGAAQPSTTRTHYAQTLQRALEAQNRKDFDTALSELENARSLANQMTLNDRESFALRNLDAVVSEGRRDYPRAIRLNHQNLAFAESRPGFEIERCVGLTNLGQLLVRLGDHQRGLGYLEQAADIWEALPPDSQARKTPSWPTLYWVQALRTVGEQDAAAHVFRRLLAEDAKLPRERRERGEEATRFRWVLHLEFGLHEYERGQFRNAESHLSEARRHAIKVFGKGHLHVCETDIDRAWVAMGDNREGDALAILSPVVDQLEHLVGLGHPRTAEAMSYLARLKIEEDSPLARSLIDKALDARELYVVQLLESTLTERERQALFTELRDHREVRIWPGVLDTYLELADALNVPPVDQYERVLFWKRDFGALSQLPDSSDGGDDLRRIFAQRQRELHGHLAQLPARAKSTPAIVRLEQQINEIERRLRDQQKANTFTSNSPSVREVIGHLPASHKLVDIVQWTPYAGLNDGRPAVPTSRYSAFVVSAEGVKRVELGESSRVDAAVRAFRKTITPSVTGLSDSPSPRVEVSPATLMDSLISPLQEAVGTAACLRIFADGALNDVPWPALPGRESTYWGEETTFLCVELAKGKTSTANADNHSPGTWLLMGGVNYGNPHPQRSATDVWPNLSETSRGLSDIRRVVAQRESVTPTILELRDAAATKAQLLEQLENCRLANLATHGYFDPNLDRHGGIADLSARFDSALVCANANSFPSDDVSALLTAAELQYLDLRNVEMVVLTACETGLGYSTRGQGMVGMVSSLRRAGVRSIISALWQVDESATRRLMAEFYRRIVQGEDSVTALTGAQRSLIEAGYQPEHWAGWRVTGEPATVLPAASIDQK